ncbi:hypothetical protein IWQ62_004570 [Dispira parvispora]|uniref:Methyltransferase domain-containing protein n=1 Tax=Dispira parvispora TaxID=1520584 RepID=A0A9W8APK0_9FUNG|nr:hypothetical protein IWQ62_004570 [Dispira parvispora]
MTEPGPVSQEGSPTVPTHVSSDIPGASEPTSSDLNALPPVNVAKQGTDPHMVLLKNTPKNYDYDKLMTILKERRITGVHVVESRSGLSKTLVCIDKNTARSVVRLVRRGVLDSSRRIKAQIRAKPRHDKKQTQNNEDVETPISEQNTPWWREPYENQVESIHRICSKHMNDLNILLLRRKFKGTKYDDPNWLTDNIHQINSVLEVLLKEALRQRYQAYQEQNIPIPRYMSQKYPELLSEFAGSNLPANQALPESATMETESGATAAEIPDDPTWEEKYQAIHTQYPLPPRINPPCPVFPTVASPVHTGYHNKCSLTFGVTPNGEPDLGFKMGKSNSGVTQVDNTDLSLLCCPRTIQLVQKMRDYVRNVSPHPVYNQVEQTGVWRLFVTRTQASGEDMVIVQYNPTNLSDEEQQAIRDDLKRLFSTSVEGFVPVTSLYIQEPSDRTSGISQNNSLVLLDGVPLIHETLLNTQFQISPDSIFPVNTLGAERFYSIVRDWAMGKPSPLVTSAKEDISDSASPNGSSDILLDLCCGRGTIGILMAKYFRQVIGIDVAPHAVKEANSIATAKGITNANFVAGPIEKLLYTQLQQLKADGIITDTSSVVAVLDPPRNVKYKMLMAIRKIPAIHRVIFVARGSANSVQDIIHLCRPALDRTGECNVFRCVQAVPVDLTPHTNACKFLIELVRESPEAETLDTSMLQ